MSTAKTTALSIALACVLVAGCGGEGSDGGGQPGQTSASSGSSAQSKGANGPTGGSGAANGSGASEDSGGSKASRGQAGSNESGGGSAESGGGSGGGGEPGGGSSPSKERFLGLANTVCAITSKESIKALGAYAKKNSDQSTAERLEGALKEVYVPALELEVAALRRLGAPRGDEAEVDAIVDAIEAWVGLAKRKGQAAKAEIDRRVARAATLARRYGLDRCSSG